MWWIYTNGLNVTDKNEKIWVAPNSQIDLNIKKINDYNKLRELYMQKRSDENIRQAEDKKFWDSPWAQFLAPFWTMYQKITKQDVNPVAYLNPNYKKDPRYSFEREAEIKDIKNQIDNFNGKMDMASSQTLMWRGSGAKKVRFDLTWNSGSFNLQNPDVDEYLNLEKDVLQQQLKSYNVQGKLSDAEKKDIENIKQTLLYINQLQSKNSNTSSNNSQQLSNKNIIQRVISWEFGNWTARKNALQALWYNYNEVQWAVNSYLKGNKNVQIPQPITNDKNKPPYFSL